MREYATGLRNPNGLAFEPTSSDLRTAVDARDETASDLVPDDIIRNAVWRMTGATASD